MLNIGLTGGIGSGKSAASAALSALGATIIDADRIAREVLEPGTDGLELVVREFGDHLVGEDGALDRAALAAIVFNDDAARTRLNQIVHPRVRARSAALIEDAGPDAIVINDIPLLAEGSMAPSFHLVVVVVAPEDVRLERLTGARGMDRADALARVRAQATDEQRAAIADVVLDNSGSLDDLRAQIDELWTERVAPYSAALEMRSPAVERLTPREGALQRELDRVRWALRGLDAELLPRGERATVRASGADPRAALEAAAWFGDGPLRSADPGGVLELDLSVDSS